MRRRLFVLLFAPKTRTRAPEDPGRLNAFAAEYNRYVEALRRGVLDPRQWARVEAAWQKF